jgi:hypothetical protein
VKRWLPHRTAAAREQLIAELERAVPLDVVARACCCPARPVVTVVMPPTASRPHPVDLLLCGHHFRASQASLRAAGADVYDKAGLLIMAGTRTAGAPRPRAERLAATGIDYRALCDNGTLMTQRDGSGRALDWLASSWGEVRCSGRWPAGARPGWVKVRG